MSDLKLRLLSFSPASAEGARLPALCALALLAGAALQLALPQGGAIPPDTGASRAADWRLPGIAALVAPSLADRASLFSPLRVVGQAPAEDDAAARPVGPLDGAFVLGTVRNGGRAIVLLREADGRIIRMAPGGSYHGARLVGIGDTAARFRQGGTTISIEYGAAAPAAGAAEDSSESEQ
ncbi:MAG: hypothetical protein RIS94_760 [Pseudomonadota bacterium]|jgi:hypothetical protein